MLGLDIWGQLARGRRKGRGISEITKAAIAIFIVNILLWIDVNITIIRRKDQQEPQTNRLRCNNTRLILVMRKL